MDYEVFLLSRIREEYTRTGDNTQAVAEGLRRTGRVFTAAAIVIAFVLAVLATSGVSLLKLLGARIALAVVVDAFLVRSLLVPAFMKVAGRANWWAPPTLARSPGSRNSSTGTDRGSGRRPGYGGHPEEVIP
jgi:RND superfamily putative drug exporter